MRHSESMMFKIYIKFNGRNQRHRNETLEKCVFLNRLCPLESSTIHIFGSESFQKMLLTFDLFVHGMEFIT